MKGTSEILDNKPEGKFIAGVVEGFYGIPWTSDQRKLLFKWMNSMGMTTYMYAPKDDAKHRAFWREQYSVEEAENLTGLIEAAAENNVQLVYALSPGLDISFSSSKDTQFLKKKLEQVAAFGCKAFALLFDDIDPELSFSDKSAFQSCACAQVSVTNDVYEYLGQPEFYFCPTEYCTSRAVPTLISSGYLNTIGSKLLNKINVLWTGSKVISKRLTIMELEEVSSVLKRPPVIWDNIHANDYDPRRIFLGPYDGRSPEIIPYIRGVLTNPNCEFESNYIPLHTLAQWSKSNPTGVKKDIITDNRLSPVASDIKLESENDYLSDEDLPFGDPTYKPKLALRRAIADWHLEFNQYRHPPKPLMVAAPVPVPGGPIPQPNTSDTSVPIYSNLEPTGLQTPLENPSFLQPTGTVLVNSLVDPIASPVHKDDSDSESDVSLDTEPMECVPSAITDSLNVLDNNTDLPKSQSYDNLMQVEIGQCSCSSECDEAKSINSFESYITVEEVDLLISLFYLPFEYGAKPLQRLCDFHWLKMNAHMVHENKSQEVTEWWERCDQFLSWVDRVQTLNDKLKQIPNQAINYYFFPYLWDLIGVLQACSAFVRWLGVGQVPKEVIPHLQGTDTWMNKDYRDLFLSGDQEPWCFNGGLQREFQRMLPVNSVDDLLFNRPPDRILNKKYNFRPYKPADERAVYDVCLKTCDDGMDGSEIFPENPEVVGDKHVGPLLTLSPELCFVLEDVEGVMGYVVAAVDARQLRQKINVAWLPSMCEKYPKPDGANELTPAEEVMSSFHTSQKELPTGILEPFHSVIKLDVLPSRVEDQTLTKRLLVSALCALKSKGSTGVHVEVNAGDKYIIEQYLHLGFVLLKNIVAEPVSREINITYPLPRDILDKMAEVGKHVSSDENSEDSGNNSDDLIEETVEEEEENVTFKSLGVEDVLCEACENLKWKAPTKIQREALPVALTGKDIIGLAETGSGKTGAFAIPILQKLLETPQRLFALILTPTRELAFQISEQFEALGSTIGVKCCVIVGGIDMMTQAMMLAKKPHVIVATPGRLVDHLENTKGFSLRMLKFLVMDEADRILNMDFEKELDKILQVIPRERNTYLFSATMTKKVAKLQRASLKEPVKVEVSSKYQTVDKLQQYYLFVPVKYKDCYLVSILNELAGNSFMVFCGTCANTQRVALMLRNLGLMAIPLHGQLSQVKRLGALAKFKSKSRSILIATDVASRGLDIPHVDVVINFDIPTHSKDYIHRVGRTARAGRAGKSITFVTQYDVELYQRIEHLIGKKLPLYKTEEDEVMVLMERVAEAQRHAKLEMNEREKDKGKFKKRKGNNDEEDTEEFIGIRKKKKPGFVKKKY